MKLYLWEKGRACTQLLATAMVLSVLFAASQASAQGNQQTSQFKSEGWVGGAYNSTITREFSYCVASTKYDTGTQLAFVLYGTNVLQLMLANSDWDLEGIPEYDINIQVDDGHLGKFNARTTQGDTLLIQIGDKADHWDVFRSGSYLVVNPGPDALVFKLTGAKRALDQLGSCVQREMAPPTSRNPFSGAGRTNPFAPHQ